MTLEYFWLAGLVGIGVTFFLLGKAIPIRTTADTSKVGVIVGWGVALVIMWLFAGVGVLHDLSVRDQHASPTTAEAKPK